MDCELPYSVLDELIDKLRMRRAMEKDYDAGSKKTEGFGEE